MANTGQERGKQLYTPFEYPSAVASCSSSPNPEIEEDLSLEALVLEAPEAPATQKASSSTPISVAEPVFSYYSARIQSMIDKQKSSFGSFSNVEFGTDSSTVHWSELEPVSHTKEFRKLNRKCFSKLKLRQDKRHRKSKKLRPFEFGGFKPFFREMGHVVVGKKIGEGGQAEVYESDGGYVVKVFHEGFLLNDLQKQWPQGMLNAFDQNIRSGNLSSLRAAFLLKDERFLDRFAFMMDRHWGDLRDFLDSLMVENGNQGPPLTAMDSLNLLRSIAFSMRSLHNETPPILHRDLKASNVLLKGSKDPYCEISEEGKRYNVTVADYECSVGVVGTGFWRAPEILQQLKNGTSGSKLEFSEKSDVYSFGMLCYELVTGGIPFEGHPVKDYDLVLNGNRPELPQDLHPLIRDLITCCWDPNPSMRPTFDEIRVMGSFAHMEISNAEKSSLTIEKETL